MNTKSAIMVQISDREWTLEVLHCACVLARNASARITLVKMIPVQHPRWLGTGLGYMNFTEQEWVDFAGYQETLEDYGVEFLSVTFQYVTIVEAIAQAAEYVDANIVFARIPESAIPFWTKFQQWSLNRHFSRQQCQWIQYPVIRPETPTLVTEAVSEVNDLAHHFR